MNKFTNVLESRRGPNRNRWRVSKSLAAAAETAGGGSKGWRHQLKSLAGVQNVGGREGF